MAPSREERMRKHMADDHCPLRVEHLENTSQHAVKGCTVAYAQGNGSTQAASGLGRTQVL